MGRTHDACDWHEDIDAAYDRRYDKASEGGLELVRPKAVRVEVISPDDFAAAQVIADRLRADALVLVDLRGCTPDLSGRLIDFCSGLVYACEGGLQYVAGGVLLLTPSHVDVSGDEAAGVRPPGFFNRI